MGTRLKNRTYSVHYQNGERLCGLNDSEAFRLYEQAFNTANPCFINPEPASVATRLDPALTRYDLNPF